MNVARINRSHGSAKDQEVVIDRVRAAAAASGRPVAILVDLQGPKIRLGRFVDDQKVMLNKGDEFTITIDDVLGTVKRASTTYKGLPGDCAPGDMLLIDDGNVAIRVVGAPHTDATTQAAASVSETDDDGHGTVDLSEEEVERSFTRDQIRELALEAIHAQRDALLQARDEGIFSSAALEGALARLDNEEILLVSSSGVGH